MPSAEQLKRNPLPERDTIWKLFGLYLGQADDNSEKTIQMKEGEHYDNEDNDSCSVPDNG